MFSEVPLPKAEIKMLCKHFLKWLPPLVIREIQIKTMSYFLSAALRKRKRGERRKKRRGRRGKVGRKEEKEEHTLCGQGGGEHAGGTSIRTLLVKGKLARPLWRAIWK